MKTLDIKEIAPDLDFYINYGLGMFMSISITDLLEREFDFDVFLESYGRNLQREFVWSIEQQQEFIISCIKGITKGITPFCLVQSNKSNLVSSDECVYQVIDGKQRIITLIRFLRGDFPIIFNGVEYYYEDIDDKCKSNISWHGIVTNLAYEYPDEKITDDQKLQWFKRVNFAGTPVEKDHLESFIKK